jgi:hypothetical protein
MIPELFKKILKRAETAPLQTGIVTDAEMYRQRLTAVMDDWTEDAADRLACAFGALPVKAERIDIGVHTDQDGAGFVSVMLHLHGPDLYILNKSIADFRELFVVRSTPTGLVPLVPSVNPFEQDFPTNKIAAEVAGAWALKVWMRAGGPETGKGGCIFGDPEEVARKPIPLP